MQQGISLMVKGKIGHWKPKKELQQLWRKLPAGSGCNEFLSSAEETGKKNLR